MAQKIIYALPVPVRAHAGWDWMNIVLMGDARSPLGTHWNINLRAHVRGTCDHVSLTFKFDGYKPLECFGAEWYEQGNGFGNPQRWSDVREVNAFLQQQWGQRRRIGRRYEARSAALPARSVERLADGRFKFSVPKNVKVAGIDSDKLKLHCTWCWIRSEFPNRGQRLVCPHCEHEIPRTWKKMLAAFRNINPDDPHPHCLNAGMEVTPDLRRSLMEEDGLPDSGPNMLQSAV